MRSEVKQRIASLRKENYSYSFIGNMLHISAAEMAMKHLENEKQRLKKHCQIYVSIAVDH